MLAIHILLSLLTICMETTLVWQLISSGNNQQLHQFFIENPAVMSIRSADGRGALWWAWEYENANALAILAVHGIDLHYAKTDSGGKKPFDLCKNYQKVLKEAQDLIEAKKLEKRQIEEQIQREKEMQYFENSIPDEDDEDDDDLSSSSNDDDKVQNSNSRTSNDAEDFQDEL
ncbi:hypothetical protein RFI_09258 [Reticulomyxa filosa]|uniref:Uncharacterized protein n=1 Tax=Reticulomyxa filosa TaxID=46433 RepID=X6NNQ1_RETFI|nr:hypothetical protein RFI_09258 [Reticulomyxa filosa]|eukprot:ETO27875.1 hypothetical protein RFI_09258 [Reticulomyxa filosa]